MENEIREIDIEKELFLLKDGKIVEPSIWNFPSDEMGFLTEIRSIASYNIYPIETSLSLNELSYRLRAEKLGMILDDIPILNATKDFVKHIEDVYHIREFEDLTKNIYGTKGSHHLGVFPNEYDCFDLTAGIHVHFSSRDSKTGDVIDLPIESIVKQMDDTFEDEIKKSNRIKGEWEPKSHGFEYRSLPSNCDIHKVLKESFRILKSV